MNKFRRFSKDAVFLALCVSKYIFSLFFITKVRGATSSGIGHILKSLPFSIAAFCPLPFFGKEGLINEYKS